MFGLKSTVKVAVPSDPRIDKCRTRLSLIDEDILALYEIFNRYDKESAGFISTADYFKQLLGIESSLFTSAMFDIIDSEYAGKITFGEFVDVTCTFACMETMELIKYCFFILDRDKVGEVDIKEVEHFIYLMWDHVTTSNLMMSIEYMHSLDAGDGRINFKDLTSVHNLYPSTFYPAFRIQTTVISTSLGETWWNEKKIEVADKIATQRKMEEMKKNRQKADLQREQDRLNEEMVKKKMGWKYYGMFWLRDKARKQIAKIAAINKQLEEVEAANRKAAAEAAKAKKK
jgi:Ca2+-binding EF-hand superfamily protein